MAVSFALNSYPRGTTVSAYPKRFYPGPPPQPGQAPVGVATATAVADEHGTATFLGLTEGTAYYAAGQIEGIWIWVSFSSGGGSMSSGGSVALPVGVVTSQENDLGSRVGNVVPDLKDGSRVFKLTSIGAVAIQAPINSPPAGAETIVEVKIRGNNAITVPGITGWEGGSAPIFNLASSSSVNRIFLVTNDGGATWEGIGPGALPSDVVRVAPGAAGQVMTSSGSAWGSAAPAVPVFSTTYQTAVDARIAALSILTGGHPMALIGTLAEAGRYLGSISGTQAEWKDFVTDVLAAATPRLKGVTVIGSGATTLVIDTYSSITSITGTKKMPGSGFSGAGRLVAVDNASGGTVKLEGRFNPAEPENTAATYDLRGAETVLFVTNSEQVWIPLASYRSLTNLEALISPGAWAALTSVGAKIEEVTPGTGYNTAGARLELLSSKVGLRGVLAVKGGQTLKPTERLCTLPAGKRPTLPARLELGGFNFDVETDGKVILVAGEPAAGTQFGLDGKSFPIT